MKNFFTSFFIALTGIISAQVPDYDITFGGGTGVAVFSSSQFADGANDMAIQANGQIVVAGYSNDNGIDEFLLIRYDQNGTFDFNFGVSGSVRTQMGQGNARAYAVAEQSDGKIVVAGFALNPTTNDVAVARYLTDGSLDPNFGTGGKVVFGVGNSHDYIFGIAIQSDGKIVLGGATLNLQNNLDMLIVRLNDNGTFDTSFDGDGKKIIPIGSSDDSGSHILIQPDGKILLAGRSFTSSNRFAIVRVNTDGQMDNTFSGDGITVTTIEGVNDIGQYIALQPDGKILVTGSSAINNTDVNISLVRYNSDGTLDNTFSQDGIVSVSYSNATDIGHAVAVQPDGKILVTGYTNFGSSPALLMRFLDNGTIDNDFGLGGTFAIAIGTTNIAYDMEIQPDGKIVVVGSLTSGIEPMAFTVRLVNDINNGVTQIEQNAQVVKLFPVPCIDVLNAEYFLEGAQSVNISIFDASGRQVHTFPNQSIRIPGIQNEQLEIPQGLPSGTYTLVIRASNRIISSSFEVYR